MADPRYTFADVNGRLGYAGEPELLLDQDAVLNSIMNILGTEIMEREFEPEFGSTLSQFLFDPIDPDTAYYLRYALIKAIQRWEPRVRINQRETTVVPDIHSIEGFYVQLAVQIIGLAETKVYPLFLRSYYGGNQ